MRLSDKESSTLALVEFSPDTPLTELAKASRIPVSVLRYNLNNMISRGVLRYYPVINCHALGYQHYSLFFSLNSESVSHKAKLEQALRASPKVSWIGEFGGSYQYCVSVMVESGVEAKEVFEELLSRFGSIILQKTVLANLSLSVFQTKYAYPKGVRKQAVTIAETKTKYDLDDLDSKILNAFINESHASHGDVARALGQPISTLEHRLKRLQERQVILQFVYLVNPLTVDMLSFKLLLYLKNGNPKFDAELFAFALEHPNITSFLRTMGTWDYEIGVEVANTTELLAISNQLAERFGKNLNRIEELTQFRELKVACYPFLQNSANNQTGKVANA